MKYQTRLAIFLVLGAALFLPRADSLAQTGKIVGYVVDEETGNALPGANIYIEGTSLGSASDVNGYYLISNVPPGTYTINAMYIGYQRKSFEIQVLPNERVERDIRMRTDVVKGQEVTVTAQAEGQMQAINQQLSARTIKNVVSKKQIQELPEANAAEAVGRLPGVSLERSGGEGNKVVIRGMGPKYALIQIDGVNMTATGYEDRSTDLSMISPYMLEGIELTKSVMANQEATATGGIVNFKIRKAPDKSSFNVIAQGGYNSLRDTYNDFKISVGGSGRFYANLLGVYAQVDYEKKDASSQQLGNVNFTQENETAPVRTNRMQLMDIFRDVQRVGGAVVLDYSMPSTVIKSSNFFSRINRQETQYQNNYDFTQQGFSIDFNDTPERWLTVLTNSVQVDHRWRNWEINSSFSHSYSEDVLPLQLSSSSGNNPTNPFPTDRNSIFNVNLDPETIPDSLAISMDEAVHFMYLDGIDHDESETRERDLAGELNIAYTLNITDQINVKLNMGGKVKHKRKEYDREALRVGGQEYVYMVHDNFELSQRNEDAYAKDNMRLYLEDFLDFEFESGDFLDGRYNFSPVFDKEKFRRIDKLGMATWDPNEKAISLWGIVHRNYIDSNYRDYDGTEDYHAFYLMPEINIGSSLLIVPGVRYESNRTEYTGYRGNRLGVLRDWRPTPIDTVTKTRKNEFFLPMIQTFFNPTDWLTIKAGYTHTLQRPNYDYIMPGWMISNQGQISNLSNFRLKPELSKNLDFQISIHSNKIGLFSIGAFHKYITDMIFWTGQTVIQDTAYFELPTLMHRQRAAYAVNNPNEVTNFGYELEWQSNFWYLPGLLRGLVINLNYTHNKSEAEYLRTRIETKAEFDENWNLITYLVPNDTTYTSPMISQPDHLFNMTLGYDYKGFSIRWAMRYKSNIFKSTNWYEKLRGYSSDFYRYDLQIRQKLPLEGLEFFLNVNNLTNELERDVINHNDYASYMEDYGRSANLGLRYQF
ncbi:TonB-dependent receptor plug domain-containing protein [candidate division KSB1 bacterium]|nr:TonB-dependent receptor plug domain-containing protein [candidate division KSB1 bacterium]